MSEPTNVSDRITFDVAKELPFGEAPERGIAEYFMEQAGYRVAYNPSTREPMAYCFPRYREGKLVAYKIKDLQTGSYYAVGDGKDHDLQGMEVEGGNKLVIVVEGELDAAAARQMLAAKGKSYTVVSLPNGAQSKITESNFLYLSQFETIMLATDQDTPGTDAANRLCEMFEVSKCKRVTFSEKDANDMLLADKGDEFFNAINNAQTMTAAGMVMSEDTWDQVLSDYRTVMEGISYMDYMPELNKMVYGIRFGELDTFTSGSGSGKTQFLRELQYHLAINNGVKVGVMSLEEPLVDTAVGQMSIAADMPLHLPEIRQNISDADLKQYWEETYGTGQYAVYDHFGSLTDDTLINKIRYMASGLGCKAIILDHLSIVISEYAQAGDERKAIDEIMTKLKRLTQELGIWIGLVVHLRKANGTPFELGAVPSVDDLRGSGGIKQLSNQVIALSRNQQHSDPLKRNTTLVTVLKSRYTGRTGPADLVQYDVDSGRMGTSPITLAEYHEKDGGIQIA